MRSASPLGDFVRDLLVEALQDPKVQAAVREALGAVDVDRPAAGDALVDKRTAARAVSVSEATLDRFVREGAPYERVGTRRRFDVAELRTWLRTRGAKPTRALPEGATDPIDVGALARRAGLRAAR